MDVPVLLIEFEGVVADTATARRDALVESLAIEGIAVDERMLAVAVGLPTEDAVRRVRRAAGVPDDETAVELGRLRADRAFAARAGTGLRLAPDARPALERLATHCRLSLVTRASRREVAFILDLAGLEGLFRQVIAVEDVTPPKPACEPWLAALARAGQLLPGQKLRALAVEDTVVGLRAARKAGIASVGVGPLAAHEAIEADAWVESLSELTPDRVRSLVGTSAGERR